MFNVFGRATSREEAESNVRAQMQNTFISGLRRRLPTSGIMISKENNEQEEPLDHTFDREYSDKYRELMATYDNFTEESSNLKEEYKNLIGFFELEWHHNINNEKFHKMMIEIETVAKIIESLYNEDGSLNREKALHIKIGYRYLQRHILKNFETLDDTELNNIFQATLAKSYKFKKVIEDIDSHMDEREINRIVNHISAEYIVDKWDIGDNKDEKEEIKQYWSLKKSKEQFSSKDLTKIFKISMLKNLVNNKDSDRKYNDMEADARFIEMLKKEDLEEFFYANYAQALPDYIQGLREMLESAFYISMIRKGAVKADVINLGDDDDERGWELGEDLEKIHLNFIKDSHGIRWAPIFIKDDVLEEQDLEGFRKSIKSSMENLKFPEVREWVNKTQDFGMNDFIQDLIAYHSESMNIINNFIPTWSNNIEYKSLKPVIDNLEKAHIFYSGKLSQVDKELGQDTVDNRESLENKYMYFSIKLKEVERKRKHLMSRLDKIFGHEIHRSQTSEFTMPEIYNEQVLQQYREEVEMGQQVPIGDTSNIILIMKEMLENPELSDEALKVVWKILTTDLTSKIENIEN